MLNEDCLIKPSWLIEQSRKLWVLTLADYTADRSRKENRRVMERKANVQESASVRGQKEKAMQHGSDQQDTAFCGKGKGKKGQKEMKGKDSFKGIPSWKGKGKGDGKNKGGKQFQQQPPQANFAQQATPSTSQAPDKQEIAQAEESWSYNHDTYWTDDWPTWESYYGFDGDHSQSDWYGWSYYASVKELTIAEDKRSENFHDFPATDQNSRYCFSVFRLFRYLGHGLVSFMSYIVRIFARVCDVLPRFEQELN